ncbi:MAG: hypothetical protein KIS62_11055 [Ramlibacter sp.]|nr:hypothetical protein [Ramlibacter sp.]
MALKLFRSTGYASLFEPGETRVSFHPGWVILLTSLWVGLACNAPLWLAIAGSAGLPPLLDSAALAILAGGLAALLLGLLAWGNTLKTVVFLLLLAAAWAAAQAWSRGLLPDPSQADRGLASLWHGPWVSWQLMVALPLLALLPLMWLRQVPVKRMSVARQLRVNLAALVLGGGACVAAASWLFPSLLKTWI